MTTSAATMTRTGLMGAPHLSKDTPTRNPQCKMKEMRLLARVALLLAVMATACGPTVDLTKGLEIEVNDTGWFDAGIVQGQNKLVPAARVTIKNVSDQ